MHCNKKSGEQALLASQQECKRHVEVECSALDGLTVRNTGRLNALSFSLTKKNADVSIMCDQ
jgi:hypothetical protein